MKLWKEKLCKQSGHLILVEKTQDSKNSYNNLLIRAHQEFREQNNYLEKEIENKTNSLSKVLQPLTTKEITTQLKEVGFSECNNLWQWGNFYAWIIK